MSNFDFDIRTQFTFQTGYGKLNSVLKGLTDEGININGYFQTIANRKTNFVRMVVGTSEDEDLQELKKVKKILRKYAVKFQEKQVIQVQDLPAGIPGQISAIYGALWSKLQVNAIYLGEDNNLYLDTSHIGQTIKILSRIDIPDSTENS
ncbi:hypothetical protein LC085_00190 [Bacillus tianshenii]|uniref:hypothetical protein n=1 Tax=Sutcliffiella tianshenii TaxID=1463404 RepID=UPI001CD77CC2|nr:hypothetical protein [Bacillus tianshenii]MCA1318313.1 hypothetical protein [Bacillus tianshenii]